MSEEKSIEQQSQGALTTAHIEMFMKMMVAYQIDELQIGHIRIKKSLHEIKEMQIQQKPSEENISDDEALFHSAM
jgi:hypothetical protein